MSVLGPAVEVKDPETYSYFKGHIIDVDEKGEKALVTYENKWQPDGYVPLSDIRPLPPPIPANFSPQSNTPIEALARSTATSPLSWWRATLRTVRGDFFLLSFTTANNQSYNEIVERECVRPLNTAPGYEKGQIVKRSIGVTGEEKEALIQFHNVPFNNAIKTTTTTTTSPSTTTTTTTSTPEQKERDSNSSPTPPSHFQHLLTLTGLHSITFTPPHNNLIFIGSPASTARAALLFPYIQSHLLTLHRITTRINSHHANLNSLTAQQPENFVETIECDSKFLGLVIGKHGKNIHKIENLPNILSVRVDAISGRITITASTAAAALDAKRRCEYVQMKYTVKKDLMGRVVGKNFTMLKEIEKASGVIRIRVNEVGEKNEKGEEMSDLLILGSRDCVEDARVLLDTHLEFLMKIKEDRGENYHENYPSNSYNNSGGNSYSISSQRKPAQGGGYKIRHIPSTPEQTTAPQAAAEELEEDDEGEEEEDEEEEYDEEEEEEEEESAGVLRRPRIPTEEEEVEYIAPAAFGGRSHNANPYRGNSNNYLRGHTSAHARGGYNEYSRGQESTRQQPTTSNNNNRGRGGYYRNNNKGVMIRGAQTVRYVS